MSGTARSGLGHTASGDMNHGVLNSAANSSGPSMGGSSQVTDANSSFSGGPQLPSSSSINDDSYMHLPASPMSSSNNISGSSVIDGSSIVQPSPQSEQIPKQSALSPTYRSIIQDAGMFTVQKRPRLEDIRVVDAGQQKVMQQILQRQQNLQLQAIVQPQRLAQLQQHQMLQSLPQLQRMQMQQPQLHMSNPIQTVSPVRPSFESGLCARRLMQYMYHQSHRPADNSILYWRKFVVEYFAPRAKKRWCFSLYSNAGNNAFGAFPQTSMDSWQCGICGSKSGKGFEATYEVIPRLDQIKFDHGVIDELLYLDVPHETRLPSGMMVLEYAKAVQESVHEHCRIVREGQLRIIFTPDLKILCWEFCARRHEELLPRRLIVHQVNQLLHAAHKYQTAVNEKGPSSVSVQDMQASCNTFVAAGRQLARSVELPLLNDLGFPKRYVRCLQISEVVNCMKDLIGFSQSHKMGPIESLKNYTQQAAAKLQAQKLKVEQNDSTDLNPLNKFIAAMHPGFGRHPGNVAFPNNSSSSSSHQAIGPMAAYQQQLLRNSPNSGHNLSPHTSDASFIAGRSFHYASTKSQQEPISSSNNQSFQQSALKDCVKADLGFVSGSGAVAKAAAPHAQIAAESAKSAPPAASNNTNNSNNITTSNNNVKQEVLENLNIADFDQDLLGELLDGIDW